MWSKLKVKMPVFIGGSVIVVYLTIMTIFVLDRNDCNQLPLEKSLECKEKVENRFGSNIERVLKGFLDKL